MKNIKYENITIGNIENMLKTGYITEIVFDADNKTVNIKEAEYLEIEKAVKRLADSMKPIVDAICESFNLIFKDINNILNKKIKKKRFMKLLQSAEIQRNLINRIIKNNKNPYTYARYYQVLMKFAKDKKKEENYD